MLYVPEISLVTHVKRYFCIIILLKKKRKIKIKQSAHKLKQIRKSLFTFKMLQDVRIHGVMYKTIFVINIIIYMCLQHSNVLSI